MRRLSHTLVALTMACQGHGTLTVVDPGAADSGATAGTTATTSEPTVSQTGPPDGPCGDVSAYDVTVVGLVVQGDQPAVGADVRLEDRGWEPGTILATDVTNDQGAFRLDVSQLVAVEDCWGVLLDYVVVAELGPASAERGINSSLFTAIYSGDGTADISSVPLDLQ